MQLAQDSEFSLALMFQSASRVTDPSDIMFNVFLCSHFHCMQTSQQRVVTVSQIQSFEQALQQRDKHVEGADRESQID